MDEILTAGEVAELLQIHPRTVYKLVREGSIPGRKFGGGWRFSRSEIIAMVSPRVRPRRRARCTLKNVSSTTHLEPITSTEARWLPPRGRSARYPFARLALTYRAVQPTTYERQFFQI